jgi:tetratricopeptide (TPR) repeat protein
MYIGQKCLGEVWLKSFIFAENTEMKRYFGILLIAFTLACSPSEEELFEQGILKLEASQYPDAVQLFDRIIEKNPKNSRALNAKGIALYQQKKFDDAILSFTAAINTDSTSYKPYLNRGNSYLEKKEFSKALIDYNRANGLDPSQTDVNYNRGLALLGMESYEDAIFDFDQALQSNPGQPLVLFNKAKAQLGNNDPIKAIESLNLSLALDSTNGPAFYLLGVTQMSALGEKEAGCANLKMALQLGFSEAKTWLDDFCN